MPADWHAKLTALFASRNVSLDAALEDLQGRRRRPGTFRLPVDLATQMPFSSEDEMLSIGERLLSIYLAPGDSITNLDTILSSEASDSAASTTAATTAPPNFADFNAGCNCSLSSSAGSSSSASGGPPHCCTDMTLKTVNSCACIVERKKILENWSATAPWDAMPNYDAEGRLFLPLPVSKYTTGPPIVECGPQCACAAAAAAALLVGGPSPCRNRVTQP